MRLAAPPLKLTCPLSHNQHERNLNAQAKAVEDKHFGLVFLARPTGRILRRNCASRIFFGITSDFELTGGV
jgi:hypothetical protein